VFYLRTAELAAGSAARVAGQSRPDLAGLARERRELRQVRRRLHPLPVDFRWKMGPFDWPGASRSGATRSPDRRCAGSRSAPAGSPPPPALSCRRLTSPRCGPIPYSFARRPCPRGPPLFGQARGLVTDIGGVAAHGSILARECGIPAVMGTGNATQRIARGRLVTVDGDAGTVTLLEEG
jgi:rifampicin phosphotransferase